MIEQYEKEYQEAKAEYDTIMNAIGKGASVSVDLGKRIRDKYRKAYHNLNGAKSADNFNKSGQGFW